LKKIIIKDFISFNGKNFSKISIDYQVYGNTSADDSKTILINHALTGNSLISGENGWWNDVVGEGKVINLNHYRVIVFNLIGNGSSNENAFKEEFLNLTLKDIAKLYIIALKEIHIKKLFANIGASIGAMLCWQMALLEPNLSELLIPIAGHYESTDWTIAFNHLQKRLLNDSNNSLVLSRMIAMLSYRNPESFSKKFQKSFNHEKKLYEIESYLDYQGEKLQKRFNPNSYKLMLHYMNEAHLDGAIEKIQSKIIQINFSSDILYPPILNEETKRFLDKRGVNNELYTIQTIHGHDAFLIEYEKINKILSNYFCKKDILLGIEEL
jgi:homoserine O-acetyltransferase